MVAASDSRAVALAPSVGDCPFSLYSSTCELTRCENWVPSASSTRDKTPPENLQLSVDAEGRFFLGKQLVASDALEDRLREQAARDPQPQLYIRGDKKVPYEHVAQAMSAAQRAGLEKIGFVTEREAP